MRFGKGASDKGGLYIAASGVLATGVGLNGTAGISRIDLLGFEG